MGRITKCDAYRIDGQIFETSKQAEEYQKELSIIAAWKGTLPAIPPQFMGVILSLMKTSVDRVNFRLYLDKLDAIDGIKPQAKMVKLK